MYLVNVFTVLIQQTCDFRIWVITMAGRMKSCPENPAVDIDVGAVG